MDVLSEDEPSSSSSLVDSVSCRESQIRQLTKLLDARFPSPSTIIIHGLESTGKSLTLKSVLNSITTPHALVRSQECITSRHLLERALSAAEDALIEFDARSSRSIDTRCESLSAFAVHLQKALERKGKFILVFDGVDQQRESFPTLLPALVRLGEIVSDLTTILVITTPQDCALHVSGVPYVNFPPYTRAESLSIVSSFLPPSNDPSRLEGCLDSTDSYLLIGKESSWLWPRFCAAVWDSLGQGAARDIKHFRAVCSRLWKPFVQPILEGTYTFQEFSKLMVKNRSLFQSDTALDESIDTFSTSAAEPSSTRSPIAFPYYTAHLLLAAYLASHTHPRHDTTLFSKSSLASRRRKKGGGTSLSRGRNPKHRKVSRHLLGPQIFPLERVFAIFHGILPTRMNGGTGELMAQVATLKGLRLLVRAGVGEEGGGGKWRVACGREFVKGVARQVGFDLDEFLIE